MDALTMEFIGWLIVFSVMVIGFITVLHRQAQAEKAKEWNRKYGNTDFENPYLR